MLNIEYDENELENQLNKGALWAITYGDLMSYLMLFFLLMFSFSMSGQGLAMVESLSEVQTTFGGEANKEMLEKKAQIIAEEDLAKQMQKKFVTESDMSKFTQVEISEEKIRITLRDAVVFDPGRADLKSQARVVLHEVAEFVRPMTNKMVIEGHTDNIPVPKGAGRYSDNWMMSMARAHTVLRYFTEEEGIPPKRLACVGYGEFQPIGDNSTLDGRAKNRRIEITLVRAK